MILLAKKGWNIGLRFDPIMLNCASKKQYIDLFEQVPLILKKIFILFQLVALDFQKIIIKK